MQINKNDILNFVQNVEKREAHHEKNLKNKHKEKNTTNNTETKKIQIDAVRSHVLNLQDEVRDIQTEISRRQIQIAYLENLPNELNWKESLQNFLNKRFQGKAPVINEENRESYISHLMHEIRGLNNSMLIREVKMENIISSRMIDLEKADISEIIMKDYSDIRKVFSKLRKDSVSHLFQN